MKDVSLEAAVVTEKAFEAMLNRIVTNCSWVNAAIFFTACIDTVKLSGIQDFWGSWVLFTGVFIGTILVAWIPRAFENPHEVARELELQVAAKKRDLPESHDPAPQRDRRHSSFVDEAQVAVAKLGTFVESQVFLATCIPPFFCMFILQLSFFSRQTYYGKHLKTY